jgi:hypothetical protein
MPGSSNDSIVRILSRGQPLQDKPDLAALVGSRICHDLISPIGAIGNGVELLTLAGGAQGPRGCTDF